MRVSRKKDWAPGSESQRGTESWCSWKDVSVNCGNHQGQPLPICPPERFIYTLLVWPRKSRVQAPGSVCLSLGMKGSLLQGWNTVSFQLALWLPGGFQPQTATSGSYAHPQKSGEIGFWLKGLSDSSRDEKLGQGVI